MTASYSCFHCWPKALLACTDIRPSFRDATVDCRYRCQGGPAWARSTSTAQAAWPRTAERSFNAAVAQRKGMRRTPTQAVARSPFTPTGRPRPQARGSRGLAPSAVDHQSVLAWQRPQLASRPTGLRPGSSRLQARAQARRATYRASPCLSPTKTKYSPRSFTQTQRPQLTSRPAGSRASSSRSQARSRQRRAAYTAPPSTLSVATEDNVGSMSLTKTHSLNWRYDPQGRVRDLRVYQQEKNRGGQPTGRLISQGLSPVQKTKYCLRSLTHTTDSVDVTTRVVVCKLSALKSKS